MLTDDGLTEIGVGITSFGMLFLFLGMVMFFDAALLALGDVSAYYTAGVALTCM